MSLELVMPNKKELGLAALAGGTNYILTGARTTVTPRAQKLYTILSVVTVLSAASMGKYR